MILGDSYSETVIIKLYSKRGFMKAKSLLLTLILTSCATAIPLSNGSFKYSENAKIKNIDKSAAKLGSIDIDSKLIYQGKDEFTVRIPMLCRPSIANHTAIFDVDVSQNDKLVQMKMKLYKVRNDNIVAVNKSISGVSSAHKGKYIYEDVSYCSKEELKTASIKVKNLILENL